LFKPIRLGSLYFHEKVEIGNLIMYSEKVKFNAFKISRKS